MLDKKSDRNAPTFIEYFANKEEFKNKFFSIFQKELNTDDNCNSSLIMLVNFICKFKRSKGIETLDGELIELVNILFQLGYKNNKIFRKLLATGISNLCGTNIETTFDLILNHLNKPIDNNASDFIFNLLREIINDNSSDENLTGIKDKKNNKEQFLNKVSLKLNEIFKKAEDEKNYFIMNKIIKTKLQITECPQDHNNNIDFNEVSSQLKVNSKIPFFNKFIKHSILRNIEKNKSLQIVNFDFINISSYNEELVVFLLKKYPSSLLTDTLMNGLLNDITCLEAVNVNISSKILEYLSNQITSYSSLNKQTLLETCIAMLNRNKSSTKLINKLLILIGKLYKQTDNDKSLKNIISLVEIFCKSNNEEDIRYSSTCCFESVASSLTQESFNMHLFDILKIFILLLNDEHPEIRNIASKIFTKMTILYYPSLIKLNPEIIFTSEFLIKKILSIDLGANKNLPAIKEIWKLYEFLIKENLYSQDYLHFNSENKVFFYEPDNRFIDNVEIKVTIMLNVLYTDYVDEVEDGKTVKPVGLLIMLESFVQYLTDNFNGILNSVKMECGSGSKDKYVMNKIRKFIYNY
jgi:hypothetical protein